LTGEATPPILSMFRIFGFLNNREEETQEYWETPQMNPNVGKVFIYHPTSFQAYIYYITGMLNQSPTYVCTTLKIGPSLGIMVQDYVSKERIYKECEEIKESDFTQMYAHVLGKLASRVNAKIIK